MLLTSLALLATGSSGCLFQQYELGDEPPETTTVVGCDDPAEQQSQGGRNMAQCEEACVDLNSSYENCGGCGTICTAGPCVLGMCTSCKVGEYYCAGACTDLTSDKNNCGECGNACATGECRDGGCDSKDPCPEGQSACGAENAKGFECINLLEDPKNCGECGNACAPGTACMAGGCDSADPCPTGQSACGTDDVMGYECLKLSEDPKNCGECRNACQGGEMCLKGGCTPKGGLCLETGQSACGAENDKGYVCLDLASDTKNCGECGNACEGDEPVCINGGCGDEADKQCSAGQILCSGICKKVLSDEENCGWCGHSCGSLECVNGQCQ